MTDAPKLRTVRVAPGRHDGAAGVVLSDPLGVARSQFLHRSTWNVARRMDGTTPCDAIAADVNATAGTNVSTEDVRAVAAELSRQGWLDDDAFEEASADALERFRGRPARPAVGPGRDYPADATELRIRVAGLVANDWDMPPVSRAFGMLVPAGSIDAFAPLFARSWASIRHTRPDRLVVLAAAGGPLEHPLVPLDRPLETPLGVVSTDASALDALALPVGRDVLAHRDALTLERQALFARLLFRDVPVLGILVGAGPGALPAGASDPLELEPITAALAALRRVTALPGRTLFVCASDLFRAGAGSASSEEPGAETAARTRSRDRACLDAAARVDAGAFWRATTFDADAERAAWSLAPTLFLALAADTPRTEPDPGPWRGSTLGYHQATGPGRLASAASLVLH